MSLHRASVLIMLVGAGTGFLLAPAPRAGGATADRAAVPLALLPEKPLPDRRQAELGKLLFFDPRLAGDGSTSCASCHQPEKGWADGVPLSAGYPGTLYFRNTPTVVNAALGRHLFWDGRLPASDLETLVRDHVSEAHFMQADGRLVIERLRQIPAYENGFRDAFGGEPSYGRILSAIAVYLQTLRSRNAPIDSYLRGNESALSPDARRGLELFRGKGGCIDCHSGPMLSDGGFHNLGLPTNAEIFRSPERHISFRRFYRMFGVAEFATLREDVGLYAVTKNDEDRGRFRTPTLREVSRTAPYMHDGSISTLEDIVAFYDEGGGASSAKDPLLRPLELTDAEKAYLVEFLKSLSGDPIPAGPAGAVEPPPYELRKLGENR